MDNKSLGSYGEALAIKFLKDMGYSIIEKNLTNHIGEIDILAENENYLVFVEVKTRRSLNYGYAYEAVDERKQMKIIQTSLKYLSSNESRLDKQIRYDIIEVYIINKKIEINHIENAFIT